MKRVRYTRLAPYDNNDIQKAVEITTDHTNDRDQMPYVVSEEGVDKI